VQHSSLPAIYPPLAQALFLGAAAVALHETGLRDVFLLLDALVVFALARWIRDGPRVAAYAWCPLAVGSAAAGHVDPLMLLFLALSGWAWERGRHGLSAAALAVAVLSKSVAALLLPWMLLRKPKAALLGFLPVVGLGYLPYLDANPFATLYSFGARHAFNASLFRVAEGVAGEGARLVVLALLFLWVAGVTLAQRRHAAALALLCAGLLACSPTVHLWYLTWFLVALPSVGFRGWTAPLFLWVVTAGFATTTYHARHAGGEFREIFLFTAAEYAFPALLALALLLRRWPRKGPLASPERAPTLVSRAVVVIPCRGEAESLAELLPAWSRTEVRKIVVADTPSGDGTRELTERFAKARYLPVPEAGYGAAVAAGLAAVYAEYVVVCDADHHLGPEQVDALLAPLRERDVGLVAAARVDARGQPFAQRFGNWLACFVIALGWGRRFHDIGPFRALKTSRWPEGVLRDRGFGWNVEMSVRALELGMEVVEVPLPSSRRRHGSDRISTTLRGVAAAGTGILRRLYRLHEEPL
ncbi:MAG: glycosyltransferase family 2 protein, partial [Planctomycetota bacterium]